MKQILILFISLLVIHAAQPQSIAINTDGSQPNASAMLDIKNINKGVLIPRVSLVDETDVITIPAPAVSLLIFNNNAALPDGQGFYYWNGSKWNKLATVNSLKGTSWGINGNSNTNTNTDFIGTTDSKPLIFKTNNILSGKIAYGDNSVFFGQSSGINITTGLNNSFFGHNSGLATTTGSGNNFIGFNSGASNTTGGNNISLGRAAGKSNTTGSKNVWIGDEAGFSQSVADEAVAIGSGAMHENTIGLSNTAVGFEALYKNTSGNYNAASGNHALFNNTTGSNNTATGRQALFSNTSGPSNTAYGYRAMYLNTSGGSNTAFGLQALGNNTLGSSNAVSGFSAMYDNTTGSDNAALGHNALYINTTGNYNTGLGSAAMQYNTTGSYNTVLGYDAGPQPFVPNLTNTTCVGSYARVTTSNTMSFGDGDVVGWAFGRNSTSVNNALQVGYTSANGNGAYLTAGGTWTNTSSRMKKENFSELNGNDLLQKISKLPIQKWKYKGTNEYHIGPVAEDFYELFDLGIDDTGISTVDPAGIALAAIKELIIENEEMKKELMNLKREIQIKKLK